MSSSFKKIVEGMEKTESQAFDVHAYFKEKIHPICAKAGDEAASVIAADYEPGCKMGNVTTRVWYNGYIDAFKEIKPELEQMVKDGKMSLEDYAQLAYETRHHARIETRERMSDEKGLQIIQQRDLKEYGNKDGPTFDWLMDKNLSKGLDHDTSCKSIIKSSTTPNVWMNAGISTVKMGYAAAGYVGGLYTSIKDTVSNTLPKNDDYNFMKDVEFKV